MYNKSKLYKLHISVLTFKLIAMKTEVYVVSLVGANVHQGYSLQGVISYISMDHLIRSRILSLYGVYFEEKASRHYPGFWEFKNISDDRDISLRIEKTTMWVKE